MKSYGLLTSAADCKRQCGNTRQLENGEDVIITTAVKDEDIPAKFPKGHKKSSLI